MAIVLKTGKTYTDCCGNIYNDAYGVIDWTLTDKNAKTHDIIIKIYKDSASRISGLNSIYTARHNCIDETEFDTYFSPTAITNDDNQYVQSYLYILQLKDEDDNLIYGDWESDE